MTRRTRRKKTYTLVASPSLGGRTRMAMTVHSNNDRSAQDLLDVLERVKLSKFRSALRWSVALCIRLRRKHLVRMKALGLRWLMQTGMYFAAASFLAARGAAISRAAIRTALRLGLDIGGGRIQPRDELQSFRVA